MIVKLDHGSERKVRRPVSPQVILRFADEFSDRLSEFFSFATSVAVYLGILLSLGNPLSKLVSIA